MYHKAQLHFKKADPVLFKAAKQLATLGIDVPDLPVGETKPDEIFRDIIWTIIGQQLSGKAADTIFGRFEKLFPGPENKKKLTPKNVLKLGSMKMRSAGLSGAKMRAIRNVSESVLTGDVDLIKMPLMSNDEIMEMLTKVKGIGPWTAEMVMMFSLGRADIFSKGDLGLKKGLTHIYGLKKPLSDKKFLEITTAWSPYRTYAARILWRVVDSRKKKAKTK